MKLRNAIPIGMVSNRRILFFTIQICFILSIVSFFTILFFRICSIDLQSCCFIFKSLLKADKTYCWLTSAAICMLIFGAPKFVGAVKFNCHLSSRNFCRASQKFARTLIFTRVQTKQKKSKILRKTSVNADVLYRNCKICSAAKSSWIWRFVRSWRRCNAVEPDKS